MDTASTARGSATQGPHATPTGASDRIDENLFIHMKEAIERALKAKGHSLIALAGNTDAGKSTAVNHCLGCTMKRNEEGGIEVDLIAPGLRLEDLAKIGLSSTQSETKYVGVHTNKDQTLVFADCNGFSGTENMNLKIAGATSIKMTLKNAKDIKLVICCESCSLTYKKGQDFEKVVKTVLGDLFGENFDNPESVSFEEKYKDSILFLFTKSSTSDVNVTNIEKVLVKRLSDKKSEEPHSKFVELYAFLLQHPEHMHFYDPLSDTSRDVVLKRVGNMRPIEKSKFDLAYSTEVQQALDQLKRTAEKVDELYSQYFSNIQYIKEHQKDMICFQEESQAIHDKVAMLNQEHDKTAQQKEQLIRQQTKNINPIDARLEELVSAKEALEKKKKILSEDCTLYLTKTIPINEPADRTEHKHSETYQVLKWDGFHTKTKSLPSTYTDNVVEKTYIYSEADNKRKTKIAKVIKSTEGGSWDKEQGGKGTITYSVLHRSAAGKPSKGSIEIYIENKDSEETRDEISVIDNQFMQFLKEQSTLKDSRSAYQNQIALIQQEIVAQQQMLRVEQDKGQEDQQRLRKSLNELERKIDFLKQKNKHLEESIALEKKEIDLLHSYHKLSGDDRGLKRIQEIFVRHEEYWKHVS